MLKISLKKPASYISIYLMLATLLHLSLHAVEKKRQMDLNYTHAYPEKVSAGLSADEAEEIINTVLSAEDNKILTPEELSALYTDLAYSMLGEVDQLIYPLTTDPSQPNASPTPDAPLPADNHPKHRPQVKKQKNDFLESAKRRRKFMDNEHTDLGNTNWIRNLQAKHRSFPNLLRAYRLRAINYIGLAKITRTQTSGLLERLSKTKINEIKSAFEEFKTTFNNNLEFWSSARAFSTIGQFERSKHKSNKWYNPFKWGKYYHAVEKICDHVISSADIALENKEHEEKQLRNKVKKQFNHAYDCKKQKFTWLKKVFEGSVKRDARAQQREQALKGAANNNFKRIRKRYNTNESSRKYVSRYLCSPSNLKSYRGNDLQHCVHNEIVEIVNEYSSYLYLDNHEGELKTEANLFVATKIAIGLRDRLTNQDQSAYSQLYERTCSYLDFCHNWLKVKVGYTALEFARRIGQGLEAGGKDIQDFIQGFGGDGTYPHLNIEQQRFSDVSFATKQAAIGASANTLLQQIKQQPLSESLGDTVEFLSRKLVHASAIIVAATTVAVAVQTVSAVAAGVAGMAATESLLEPLEMSLSSDGTAAVSTTRAVVSAWDAVCVLVGEVATAAHGVLESGQALFCMGDGDEWKTSNEKPLHRASYPEDWLDQQEALGGHTIVKHVGKSDAELINRLNNSRRITGASTFTNIQTARKVVIKAIESNKTTISNWLKNSSDVPKLRLEITLTESVGRGIFRRSTGVINLSKARVILKATGKGNYFVLTAYPLQ